MVDLTAQVLAVQLRPVQVTSCRRHKQSNVKILKKFQECSACPCMQLDVLALLQIVSRPGAPQLPPSDKGHNISFQDVHFSYRPDAPILRGVSFDVPAGTSCALVGTSGSGKSTLLRLLFRFYDASEGSVAVDGRDVKDWDLASVRRPMGSVPQVGICMSDIYLAFVCKRQPFSDELRTRTTVPQALSTAPVATRLSPQSQ